MKSYLTNSPFWLQMLYPSLVWRKPSAKEKTVYLTFDDGPTPTITEAVLEMLEKYNAKATFFLIGKNAEAHTILTKIINIKGHTIGNHTQNHLNGWEHKTDTYLQNIQAAEGVSSNTLFRPPYGRIKRNQIKALKNQGYTIVMWDVLSADFDTSLNAADCVKNVLGKVKNGSIVVFHDSEKAWPRLKDCLPEVLKVLHEKGFVFKALEH